MSAYKPKFLKQQSVGVIPVPFSGGQNREGVDHGPVKIIEFGLLDQLKDLGWSVSFDGHRDYTQLRPASDPPVGKLLNARYVSAVTESVAHSVEAHLKKGSLALTLGGDHSVALGTFAGTARVHPDAALIWIDAHSDIHTPETTDSGNIHGCPVSFLLGIAGKVEQFNWVKPCLTPDRLVYIGLRDVDAGEKRILRENGIKAFSMHEVDKYGIAQVVQMAINHVSPNNSRPIHLSFDVDALDPSVAPSTGTPVRGGLTFREGHYICEAIHETGCLVAMDLMEVNPSLEDDESVLQTVTIGCSLVRGAMGETLL
ncbi:Arginase, catabolizes arginine to ornithine and urea [Mortierella sp. GBA35]|nr:Arginase, catabolizes arginine to ornithine and urea [Mortierella sp. AD031]KAF9106607.1 Arginase, catabolizes arginine to ornithine and urea [Mortierella sp. GBA35]KAG0217072.1 Arginase, catabolizes arginine to ornithine and urea [Mortierella sp. NVP41]